MRWRTGSATITSQTRQHPANCLVLQRLCRDCGIEPKETVLECKEDLKNILVNIVDLISANEVGEPIPVWAPEDWHKFRSYTMEEENRFELNLARRSWILSLFLKKLNVPL